MTPRNTVFQTHKTDVHMSSQRLWQHAQSLHRSKPDGVPALRWRSTLRLTLLTKKLSVVVTNWQSENKFASEESN